MSDHDEPRFVAQRPRSGRTKVLNGMGAVLRQQLPQVQGAWVIERPPWIARGPSMLQFLFDYVVLESQSCSKVNVLDLVLDDFPRRSSAEVLPAQLENRLRKHLRQSSSSVVAATLVHGLTLCAASIVIAAWATLHTHSLMLGLATAILALLLNNALGALRIPLSSLPRWTSAAYDALLLGTSAWLWLTSIGGSLGFFASVGLATLTLSAATVVSGALISASRALRSQKRAEELEDEVCFLLCYLRHFPLFHQDDWGHPSVIRKMEENQRRLSRTIRRRLPFRLSPTNPARRRALQPVANSIADQLCEPPELASMKSRTSFLRLNGTALKNVNTSDWISMTDTKPMASRSALTRELGFILSSVSPLVLFVLLRNFVSGEWDLAIIVSIFWLGFSFLSRLDPGFSERFDRFGRARREATSAFADSTPDGGAGA